LAGFFGQAMDTAALAYDFELIAALKYVPDDVDQGRGAIHQNSDFARRHIGPSVRQKGASRAAVARTGESFS
jgi:hypothetical protein